MVIREVCNFPMVSTNVCRERREGGGEEGRGRRKERRRERETETEGERERILVNVCWYGGGGHQGKF